MQPLKLMLVTEATEGGTARYLEEVAGALCEAGVEVHVVCSARRKPGFRTVMTALRCTGVRVTELDMSREIRPARDARAIFELGRLFLSSRPDVIHLHSSKAGALGRIAGRLTRQCPVVYTPQAYAFLDDSNPAFARLVLHVEGALGRWTDHLMAVSESEADQALLHRLVPPDRVSVAPGGLGSLPEEEAVRAAAESRLAAHPRLRLGCLGRLERQKDPIQLIRLAALLERLGVAFELDIVGSGSLGTESGRYCRACGLARKVRFLGQLADATAFYRSIDVFTLASRYEGLPYSVLDAMSWGLPVVAFDVPGVNDVVVSGVTGFLVKPGAVDQLADRVVTLADDPSLRTRMGQAGRQRVTECFRLDRHVTQLNTLYETLAERRVPPQPADTAAGRISQRVSTSATKVLYVSDCGFLGEAERSLLELMQQTRHHGVKPYLMCPPQSPLARAAKERDVPVIDWPLQRLSLPGGIAGSAELVGSVPAATFRALGVLRRYKVDIVHTNSTAAQLQVGLAARLARTPCIWHWRDFHDLPRISRAIARTADMSIAVSQSVYDFALAQLGRAAPLMMIRSGLESPGTLPEADVRCHLRSKWGVTDSEILIGMMGQARPSKGHQVFIRAMDEVVAHRPDLRAILLHTQLDGEQERYLGELDSLAGAARCRDRLTFAEPGDDIPAVLHALDIVVVPSLREPFGRVAVEAMLAEKPVVASAVDSLAEIVGDAKTGLLVPPGDEHRLAEAVVMLADDPELRRRMGVAGRERALHRYSIARTAMEIVECYRRVRERV